MKRHSASESNRNGQETRRSQSEYVKGRKRNASLSMVQGSKNNNDVTFDRDFLCDRTVQFMESGDTRNIVALELAEQSMYFERLVRYHEGKGVIQLPVLLRVGFDSVIEFIRKGKTDISEKNVYDIFIASDFLLVFELRKQCTAFINNLADNPTTCIIIWVTCRDFHWPELGFMAYNKLLANFENIWQTKEFCELDHSDVKKILLDDSLNCKLETTVIEAISRWILIDKQNRCKYSNELFLCARIGMLSAQEVELLKQQELVINATEFYAVLCQWPTTSAQAAIPRIPHQAIFVFGGWCEGIGPRSAAQVYNPRANHWILWTQDTTNQCMLGDIPKRVYAGCAIVDNHIYLVGGFDGNTALKSILSYDLELNSGWNEISCMYEKRYYVSVAHADNFIYAIGGHNGETNGRLDSAEKFNLKQNLWEPIARMNRIRSDASAASLFSKIYVAGGFEGRRYHDSAEVYNPLENQWTLISRMHSPRGGVCLVKHDKYLYALGGNDGVTRLKTIERFDPETGRWEVVCSMQKRKSNLSASVIDDNVYILGGWSDEGDPGILDSVEKFNVGSMQCTYVSSLSFPASATCSCTVTDKKIVMNYLIRHDDGAGEIDQSSVSNTMDVPM